VANSALRQCEPSALSRVAVESRSQKRNADLIEKGAECSDRRRLRPWKTAFKN